MIIRTVYTKYIQNYGLISSIIMEYNVIVDIHIIQKSLIKQDLHLAEVKFRKIDLLKLMAEREGTDVVGPGVPGRDGLDGTEMGEWVHDGI